MANTSNRIIKCPKLYFMDTGLVIDSCDKIRVLNEHSFCFPVHLLGL